MRHRERHRTERIGWLRAAVLGANDGIDATRQEMRSYVCGQCHVEYYFKGNEKRLTYPWDQGLKADDILAYYEQAGVSDWTHAESGAPMLKAQHPEFELWSQGIHARSDWPEEELRERVHMIQHRTYEVRNLDLDALIALIGDIKSARGRGISDAVLEISRRHHRRAQFLLDFVEAENSMGFHADQEAMRVLALSLDETRRGQLATH